MAKSGKTKSARRAPASSSGRSAWFKLILIPYTAVYVWLMGLFDLHSLDFIKRFMDYWGRDAYTLNFVCLFVMLAGLIVLLLAPCKNRIVAAVGLLMYLMPVWFQGTEQVANEPAALRLEWNTLRFLFEIATALWALMLLRGDKRTEWVKLIMAFVLIAVNLLPYLAGHDPQDIYLLFISIIPLCLLTGFVMDFCVNGFSLQSLVPAIIAVAASLLAGFVDYIAIFWGLLAACIAGIVLILIKSRSMHSVGGISALLCIIINTLLIMLQYVWKLDLPKIF